MFLVFSLKKYCPCTISLFSFQFSPPFSLPFLSFGDKLMKVFPIFGAGRGQCSTSHLCHTDSISVTLTSIWHWKIFRNPKTLWVPLYGIYSKKGSCHLRKDSQLDRGLYLPQCPSLNYYHHSHSNNSAVPTIHHIHLLQVSVHPSPCRMYGVLINYVQKNFVYLHPHLAHCWPRGRESIEACYTQLSCFYKRFHVTTPHTTETLEISVTFPTTTLLHVLSPTLLLTCMTKITLYFYVFLILIFLS